MTSVPTKDGVEYASVLLPPCLRSSRLWSIMPTSVIIHDHRRRAVEAHCSHAYLLVLQGVKPICHPTSAVSQLSKRCTLLLDRFCKWCIRSMRVWLMVYQRPLWSSIKWSLCPVRISTVLVIHIYTTFSSSHPFFTSLSVISTFTSLISYHFKLWKRS